ncbi:MAG TPA: hypothetical protein PKE51_05335, partial [Gemmatimonadaceae bacterium]|nr:hypothetical protein [Gemmatimonadaceae bacterium]
MSSIVRGSNRRTPVRALRRARVVLLALSVALPATLHAQAPAEVDSLAGVDYLAFAQGAHVVAIDAAATAMGIGVEQAMLLLDGDDRVFSLTPKGTDGETAFSIVFALPSPTTFTHFGIPSVLETPSPAQTFVRDVEIEGASASASGPFSMLARASLRTHASRGRTTRLDVTTPGAVRWVRVTFRGGIDRRVPRTFLEFSELQGYGSQETVPRSEAFSGRWRGRGVQMELHQSGAMVTGCFDGAGELTGTVTGSLLRAVGRTRVNDIPHTFVLAVDSTGALTGVRSTNGAPFRPYAAAATAGAPECPPAAAPLPACGAVLHGITFEFDSAVLRAEADQGLDPPAAGLAASPAARNTLAGHTAREGST